ncbi:ABC transporter ATP-binding protein [Fusibacter paucivorans]|uniref:ABC transporter ATP-binding protein n=1 Tax=Fusibacter paucivorans TaxID=76009 RepID=A0ABS5PM61_9FIRM|nr:ABC transporter ATP-binding protein [Fusibacter paucivorans]MBS7526136.1 ABC transporter ATP-binding protein [Fusibacter paucivorans]
MLNVANRIIKMSGKEGWRIKAAIVLSVFEGIFIAAPLGLIYYGILIILESNATPAASVRIGIIMLMLVLFRAFFKFLIDKLQGGMAYELFASERLKLGEHLKRLPMGYFSEGNIGNITSVITTDIVFAEQWGMHAVATVISSYVGIAINILLMLFIDWRVSLILTLILIVSSITLKQFNRASKKESKIRQDGFAQLTKAIIEYVKGIGVIKSFNVQREGDSDINHAFDTFKAISIRVEKGLSGLYRSYMYWFALGVACIIATAVYDYNAEHIQLAWCILILLFSMQFFASFKALGSMATLLRVMEAGLDRYDAIIAVEEIDADGKAIVLDNFDIVFDHVSFAYDQTDVIHDVSFEIPARCMTALVGKSGSGKSTITNLIARFWDVQQGAITIGGVNIKEMTVESLLENISMVFQNVYLFNDSILENVRFGRPEATKDEIIEVCKKARCHEFIMALENGYDTIVNESGASLSGGEKQRIAIARAMLKDAPIILLDEATANIDPDNEQIIQEAINALVQNKTLVLIAHKLSTIRNADQIIVMEEGRIIQQGNHKQLIESDGLYLEFWKRRTKATSWKIS